MIKLTAETVMRFVLTRSRMKAFTEKEKSQGDAIKEAMEAREVEEVAPTASPFKLLLRKCMRSEVDYEDMAKRAFREIYGREWKLPFEKAKKRYGQKPVVSLGIEPNERYKPT